MSDSTTPFSNKAQILADIWLNYRQDEEFADYVEYNDLGLPLSYCVANGIIEQTDSITSFIDEAWELLLAALELEDDGFTTLDEMLGLE